MTKVFPALNPTAAEAILHYNMPIFRNFVIFACALVFFARTDSATQQPHSRSQVVIIEPRTASGKVQTAIKKYSRLRDYYVKSTTSRLHVLLAGIHLYPYFIIANTVAVASNSTLLEIDELCQFSGDCDATDIPPYPRILPSVPVIERSSIFNKTVFSIWNEYCSEYSLTSECTNLRIQKFAQPQERSSRRYQPHFFLISTDVSTFFYCGVAKKLQFSPWSFTIFMIPFDNYTWMCLFAAFVALITLFNWLPYPERMSSVLMKITTPLLGFGTQPLSTHSHTFILWMVVSTILVTFYSGEITSSIISPTPDDVIRNIPELYKRNYTLHFPNFQNYDELFDATMNSMKSTSATRKALEFFKMNKILDLDIFDVAGFDNVYMNDRTFTVLLWRLALHYAETGNRRIMGAAKGTGVNTRKCYVGEEYLSYDIEFFAILPAENFKLVRAFQSLDQAGIVQRFLDELRGVLTFDRVQDRVRLMGKTNLNHEKQTKPESLKWHGKTVTIFLLWILGSLASLTLLLWEIFVSKKSVCLHSQFGIPVCLKVENNFSFVKEVTTNYELKHSHYVFLQVKTNTLNPF